MKITADVKDRLLRMSFEEKIGQVFVFTWRNRAQAARDLRLFPGGYIRIYSDVLTVARESAEIQAESATPLFMTADFERGIGGTIPGAIEVVSAMALGATGDEKMAYDAGQMIGREALAIGINMDYAPVLDVNSNPKNPVINTRSFGENPVDVACLGVAFMRGLQDAGVGTCGKHFPGHGNTSIDSHSNLGEIAVELDALRQIELVPFKAAIAAGIDAIMSAHLLVPAMESERLPATLSRRVMTEFLRGEMGFDGVAVTDALDMGAIVEHFPPEVSIPMALNAGCDQLIMPANPALCVDILSAAVRRGDISEERLNEAVSRVLTLKENRGVLAGHSIDQSSLAARLNTQEHRDRALEIADKSITAVHGKDRLPLSPESRVLCVELGSPQRERSYYLEPRSFTDYLSIDGADVARMVAPGGVGGWHQVTPEEWAEEFRTKLESADVVVLAVYAGIRLGSGEINAGEDIAAILKNIMAGNNSADNSVTGSNSLTPTDLVKPLMVASFGSPYVLNDFPEAVAALCAFSETQASQHAMARAIWGAISIQGQAPVTITG